MHPRSLHHDTALLAVLAACLSACGGGGGGTPATAPATSPVAAVAAPQDVAAIVPGAGMTWAMSQQRTLAVQVTGADGQAAAGAAVRLFTASRQGPHDGAPLDEPVAMSLLDTVVSDGAGRATITLQWPGHADELLVVATQGDTQGRAAVAASGAAEVSVGLAR